MAQKISVKLAPRTITGRKVKQLRKQGIIPINIYGNNITSISAQIELAEFEKLFQQAGETSVITATVGDKKLHLLLADRQTDPVTDQLLHVDFRAVDLRQKITAAIPVVIIGESEAVKEQGGVLYTQLDEIEVEALPNDLVDEITIDCSILKQIGDSVTVADISLPDNITVMTDSDSVIVSIAEPQKEEETEVVPVTDTAAEDDQETPSEETDTQSNTAD